MKRTNKMYSKKLGELTRVENPDEEFKRANDIRILIGDWLVLMRINESGSECKVSLVSDRRGSRKEDIMLQKQVLYVLERRIPEDIPFLITSNFPSLCSKSEDY